MKRLLLTLTLFTFSVFSRSADVDNILQALEPLKANATSDIHPDQTYSSELAPANAEGERILNVVIGGDKRVVRIGTAYNLSYHRRSVKLDALWALLATRNPAFKVVGSNQ